MQAEAITLDKAAALEITKANGPQLAQWHERKLIHLWFPGKGQGRPHNYRLEDLCKIKLFMRLNDAGFTRPEASRLAFDKLTEDVFGRMVRGWLEELEKDPQRNVLRDPSGEALDESLLLTSVVFMREGDGKLNTDFFWSSEEFSQLYKRLVLNPLSHIVNLSVIVIEVLQVADKLDKLG
jgi:hypothetical protein